MSNWKKIIVSGSHAHLSSVTASNGSIISGSLTMSGSITNVDNLNFYTTSSAAGAVGRFVWNDGDGTLDLGLKGGNVTLAVGEQTFARVYNGEGTTLNKGEVVYISGSQGNRILVKRADYSAEAGSSNTLGFVAETIISGAEGFVITNGVFGKLNTVGLTGGSLLYLSSSGQYTQTKTVAPKHTVILGYVERVHATVGSIYVKIDNGYELGELHNVLTNGVTNGDLLAYSGSVWTHTKQLSGSYGVTGSIDISGNLIINGTNYTAASSGTSGTSGANGSSGTAGSSGNSGSSGTSGNSGSSGTSGNSGSSGTSGANGSSGTSGNSGSSGTSGANGSSGSSGTSGANGSSGSSGTSGANGNSGTSGSSGTSGANGSSGTSGSAGTSGANGSSGTSGTSGANGSSGTAGSSGNSGSSGTSGANGTSGSSGTSGANGSSGSSGTSGANGSSGTSGANGSSGTSGANGSSGTSGAQGDSGSSGTSGANGSSGTSGAQGDSGSSGTSGNSGSSGTSGNSGSSGTSGNSGSSGTSGNSGSSGTSGVNGTSGTSGTGFSTISNASNNRVLTSDGTSNAAVAESNLTFDGTLLTITGNETVTGTSKLTDIEERELTVLIGGSPTSLSLDLSTANVFEVTWNNNVNSFTISNPPATDYAGSFTLVTTGNGSPYTWNWGSAVTWSGGSTPTITSANGKKDIFGFISTNQGTNWYGFIGTQNV